MGIFSFLFNKKSKIKEQEGLYELENQSEKNRQEELVEKNIESTLIEVQEKVDRQKEVEPIQLRDVDKSECQGKQEQNNTSSIVVEEFSCLEENEKQLLQEEIIKKAELKRQEEQVKQAELKRQNELAEQVRQAELKQQKKLDEQKNDKEQKQQEAQENQEQLNKENNDLFSNNKDGTNKSHAELGVNKNEHNFSEVQIDLLKKLKSGTMSFLQINKKYLDEEFCLEAVKYNGHILNFIPKNIINLNMCIEAVSNNINAMSYVPISLRNEVNKVVDLEKHTMYNISSNNDDDDDDNIDIKELMEEGMPGKNPSYYSYEEIEHDGGSLYDQYEYIRDHMDN